MNPLNRVFQINTPGKPSLRFTLKPDQSRWVPVRQFSDILGLSLAQDIMPKLEEHHFWGFEFINSVGHLPSSHITELLNRIKDNQVVSSSVPTLHWLRASAQRLVQGFPVQPAPVPFLVEEEEADPILLRGSEAVDRLPALPHPVPSGLQTFNFRQTPIRVVMKDGEPWWMAGDVCSVLDLGNVGQSLTRLDPDEKDDIISNDVAGRPNHALVINESGLYSLVLGSRKPEAKAFKKWITSEVIPSIRKTGSYSVQQFELPGTYREALADLLLEVEKTEALTLENKEQKATIAVLEPKADFHDRVSRSKDQVSVREFAQILGTGQNRLYDWFRKKQYMSLKGTLPIQHWVDIGLFALTEVAYEDKNGHDRTFTKTMITGKGQVRLQQEWNCRVVGKGME